MFNLDQAVEQWSRSIDLRGCGRQDHLEELQDHLYCEINRLQEQGLSPELAFLKATQQLGNLRDLSAEYAKNKSLLELLCAAAILATPLLVSDGNEAGTLLFLVLVPLWFATYILLPGIRHQASCEWQAMQRLLGRS